jgi:hypothetical protein
MTRTTPAESPLVASRTDGQECEGRETPRNRTNYWSREPVQPASKSGLTTGEAQAPNTNSRRASPSQPNLSGAMATAQPRARLGG